jgi:ribosomal protein S27AE
MDDQHIDGNVTADVVGEVDGAEMSAVLRTCQSCGDRRAIGEHRSYRSVGVVLRCPACEDAGVVLGVHEKRLVVEWRGRYDIAR